MRPEASELMKPPCFGFRIIRTWGMEPNRTLRILVSKRPHIGFPAATAFLDKLGHCHSITAKPPVFFVHECDLHLNESLGISTEVRTDLREDLHLCTPSTATMQKHGLKPSSSLEFSTTPVVEPEKDRCAP